MTHGTPPITSIKSNDGTQLHARFNEAANPKGSLLLVHGFGEHCGRYDEMTGRLTDEGFNVFRFDYRGHGQSEGRRGHVYQFSDYIQDFNAARDALVERNPDGVPIFVLAHSYGGLITIHAVSRDADGIAGVVLSSPFFGFAIKVPLWKAAAGNMLSRYVPAFSMPTDIDPKVVSHDPAIVEQYGTDPLIGRVATSRWFTETQRAQQQLNRAATRIHLPVLFQQAGDDKLVDAAAGRCIYDLFASTDKTWEDRPGEYHEIWFELEREETIGNAISWLEARCA